MAYTALIPASLSYLLAAGAVAGASLGAWLIRFPRLAISLLAVSLVAGQLFRLPLPGQGGGLLLSDVATVLVILSALLQTFSVSRRSMTKSEIRMTNLGIRHWSFLWLLTFVIGIFVLWSLFTLVIHAPSLGVNNFLVAFLYWGRLAATLALLPALLWLFREPRLRHTAQRLLLGTITALVAVGFLQLIFAPDLAGPVLGSLSGGGWDPHQGRLFSTWLDPNLFGGFLIVVLPWLAVLTVERVTVGRVKRLAGLPAVALAKAGPLLVITVLTLTALLSTQSRSSALALFGAILLLSPFVIWQLRRLPRLARLGTFSSITLGIIVIVVLGVFLAPNRLAGLLTIDDTAALRLNSLSRAWKLVEYRPWAGVGYNAYQFAAAEEGFSSDFTIHSRAASDNSLLTLWVTTGLVGVLLFLIPWAIILGLLLRRSIQGHVLALGAAASLTALFLQAQFINSFLYSHLLITLIIVIAITMTKSEIRMTREALKPNVQ